ncbi:hypothetical protein [Psychrosphaera haliotis]|uniref:F5/8 type C domain-containing protein n=1 Tax=Psychrosphaera haliotis TaxID=555083 RepID=A0A6N8F8Y8_9GAMM|nr:hypothetical protein [Psychrosphaera haliotis]MUH71370.1 hypothetical protein [Psychrosphaera haliotis]
MLKRLYKGVKSQSEIKLRSLLGKSPNQAFVEMYLKLLTPQKATTIASQFPGFVFGPIRNLSSWFFEINKSVSTIKVELGISKPISLNFNHIIIWVRDSNGNLVKYNGEYQVEASSFAKGFEDIDRPLKGNTGNTVSFHSKRQLNPWWQVKLDGEYQVEYVEYFNRKDNFGFRGTSLVCTAFRKDGKKVIRASRFDENKNHKVFLKELNFKLAAINAHFVSSSNWQALDNFYGTLLKLLKLASKSDLTPANKNHMKSHLITLLELFNWDSPDIGLKSSEGEAINVGNAKFLRVVAFKRPLARPMQLTYQTGESKENTLMPTESHNFDRELLELRKNCFLLPQPHVFDIDLADNKNTETVNIWAPDLHSAMGLVLREAYTSNDGISWTKVSSTLANFNSAVSLIGLYEWVAGKQQSLAFTERMGFFFGVYRLHRARAYKKFFVGNKENLSVYMEAIEKGGEVANYLPKVIFTRHGLNIPFSEIDPAFLAKRMHEFCQLIKTELGQEPFPCFGTLLGIYRDNSFLPHDDDIDVAILVDPIDGLTNRQIAELWRDKIEKLGIATRFPTPYSLNFHCYFSDCDMDIFIKIRDRKTDYVHTHMERYQVRKVERNLFEPLGAIEFLGLPFKAPHNIEGFLQSRYGPGWIKPDPTFEL